MVTLIASIKCDVDLLPTDDGTGDGFLCIPEEVMKLLALNIGDTVNIEILAHGSISISKFLEIKPEIDQEILSSAEETFNSTDKAAQWLSTYHITLGMTPMEYVNSGGRKAEILKILNAIKFGGVT